MICVHFALQVHPHNVCMLLSAVEAFVRESKGQGCSGTDANQNKTQKHPTVEIIIFLEVTECIIIMCNDPCMCACMIIN